MIKIQEVNLEDIEWIINGLYLICAKEIISKVLTFTLELELIFELREKI